MSTNGAGLAAQGWLKVVYASDCEPCDMCGEPVCAKCEDHYAECECPGPTMDESEYEYEDFDGVEYARMKQNGE